MAEIRRGYNGDAPHGERLPWLEPVEDEYEPQPEGGAGLAVIGLALLVLVGLAVGAFVYYRHWSASRADLGQIIRAPAGPYKVRPSDPGGLKIDAAGAVAEHTGTGGDIDAPLDLAALPEKPMTGPGSEPDATEPIQPPAATAPKPAAPATTTAATAKPAAPLPAPAPAPPPAAPVAPAAKPVATGGSGTIQLGALASEAKAKAVWKAMSGRFDFLAPLTMSITPVKVGDNTLYRLRAGGGNARTICARLKIAGEACTIVTQ
jgi:cell division septation protein DedD